MSMRIKAPAVERRTAATPGHGRSGRARRAGWAFVLMGAWVAPPISAQAPASPITHSTAAYGELVLDSLVALALEANPRVHAARAQVEAARARIAPAGALPDPMLGIGVMNLPVSEPGFRDDMTMKTIAVGQQLPFPGKLALARRAAEHELRAAEARLEGARIEVAADVREAYYETAWIDRAAGTVRQRQRLVTEMIHSAESHYAAGRGEQSDVLRARLVASRLAEEAVELAEARRAAVARLNALLSQPAASPLPEAAIPDRIMRAAVADRPSEIRFTSSALGARAADSPLPPLAELQDLALRHSPEVRAHEAEIAAQSARLELARRGHLPDFDILLQYGQRSNRMDVASLLISVPLPLHRRARQDAGVAEARAQLTEMHADHQAMVDRLHAEVAALYADLERDRAQLALFVAAILPQGRASVESATASFRVGRVDFTTLLETEATLYEYETALHRALADFAKTLANLERIIGTEVLP